MSFPFRGALAAPALALAAFLAAGSASASPCTPGGSTQPGTLSPEIPASLDAVITEIRRASPDIRAAGLEARALRAEADQAGRRLNPSVSVELENFSGNGALSGFDRTESTFAVEQTFRLGNKRALSERAARGFRALTRTFLHLSPGGGRAEPFRLMYGQARAGALTAVRTTAGR